MHQTEAERYLSCLENGTKYVPAVKEIETEKERSRVVVEFAEEMNERAEIALQKHELEKYKVSEAYGYLKAEIETKACIKHLDINLKNDQDFEKDFLFIERMRKIACETGNPFASIISESSFFVPNSISLIGAVTGCGKSSVGASLALCSAEAGKRTLYISNEENSSSHMLRVSSIACGIRYKGYAEYSDEEMLRLKEMSLILKKNIKHLDDNAAGKPGLFTTVEGWEAFFDKLESDQSTHSYDNIIIDYYQGLFSSIKRPNIPDHEAQSRFVQRLERFREKVGIPVIILAQLWANKGSFHERIKGSRSIMQRVTGAFEIIPNFEASTSELKIHKSRIRGELVGKSICLKQINGRFIHAGLVL